MWKKFAAMFLTLSLVLSITAPLIEDAEAKPRYRSPARSFTPDAPAKTPNRTDSVTNSPSTNRSENINNGAATNRNTTTPGTAMGRTGSALGSGGFMKGLMLGGLAGLLFGGFLSGLGALGPILGALINIAAIVLIIALAVKVIQSIFTRRNRPDRPRGDYR